MGLGLLPRNGIQISPKFGNLNSGTPAPESAIAFTARPKKDQYFQTWHGGYNGSKMVHNVNYSNAHAHLLVPRRGLCGFRHSR
jgi:hypothetical protein